MWVLVTALILLVGLGAAQIIGLVVFTRVMQENHGPNHDYQGIEVFDGECPSP